MAVAIRSSCSSALCPSLMCQTPGRMPQARERSHAADAEDDLLRQPHRPPLNVEHAGDRAVGRVVGGDVGVEQDERDAADLGDPEPRLDLAPGQRHADQHVAPGVAGHRAHRQPREVVLRVGVLLVAVGVDRLLEVAGAIEQPDADQRQAEVAGALQMVAGEDAEAAGVDRQRLVHAVLHREVGDRAAGVAGILAGEPGVAAGGEVALELADHRGVGLEEGVVLEQRIPVPPFDVDQHLDRVVVERPGPRVDGREQLAGPGIPGPPEVVGEVVQPLDLVRQLDVGNVLKGDREIPRGFRGGQTRLSLLRCRGRPLPFVVEMPQPAAPRPRPSRAGSGSIPARSAAAQSAEPGARTRARAARTAAAGAPRSDARRSRRRSPIEIRNGQSEAAMSISCASTARRRRGAAGRCQEARDALLGVAQTVPDPGRLRSRSRPDGRPLRPTIPRAASRAAAAGGCRAPRPAWWWSPGRRRRVLEHRLEEARSLVPPVAEQLGVERADGDAVGETRERRRAARRSAPRARAAPARPRPERRGAWRRDRPRRR